MEDKEVILAIYPVDVDQILSENNRLIHLLESINEKINECKQFGINITATVNSK